MILAAIDIGSNAARLLITEMVKDDKGNESFNKLNLVRVPLRLGFDVFDLGMISKPKMGMMLQTMKSFKHLCNAYAVEHIIACATSAQALVIEYDTGRIPDLRICDDHAHRGRAEKATECYTEVFSTARNNMVRAQAASSIPSMPPSTIASQAAIASTGRIRFPPAKRL